MREVLKENQKKLLKIIDFLGKLLVSYNVKLYSILFY